MTVQVSEVSVTRTASGTPVRVRRDGVTSIDIQWGCSRRVFPYEMLDQVIGLLDAMKNTLNVWVQVPYELTGRETFYAIFPAPGMLMVENRPEVVPREAVSTADLKELKKAIKMVRGE